MSTWQDQKALDVEQRKGEKLARRWLELQTRVLALTEDARHVFDRVLKHVVWAADGELENSPLAENRASRLNTMGGPEPTEPGVPVVTPPTQPGDAQQPQ